MHAKRIARQQSRAIWAAAANNRLTEEFLYALRSPDMELRQELRVLRSRARQLARDDPHVKKFLLELKQNVIGPKGVRLRARHMTTNDPPTMHIRANGAIEDGWRDFSRKENATASKKQSLTEFAGMVLQNVAVDGEAFIHRLRGYDNAHLYSLDMVDPDQFDETYFRYAFEDDQTEIRMGVEINRWGEELAFWPWKRHPSEYAQQIRIRIPATEMLHIFIKLRSRQTRGVTWLAPVIRDTKMYGGYQEAELVASRNNANAGGFIETDPTKGGQYATATEADAQKNLEDRGIEWPGEPGIIPELAPGQTFHEWRAAHPSGAYESFSRQILMSIAAGIGMSYASLTGDLSRANYSSLREGKLGERDYYETIQEFLVEQFYDPIYRDWLPLAMLVRKVALPTENPERWMDVEFLPRGWDWVDPWKDLQATSLKIAMGLTSRTRECAATGVDFEEILKEQAHEQELQKQYGVTLSLDTRLTATPGAGGSDDKNEQSKAEGQGGGFGETAYDGPLGTRVRLNGSNHVEVTR